MWSYWIIGLAAMMEAFFVTGIFVPGTLIVDAGGVLVRHGALDFFDLAWFVALGSILGGEIGYRAGLLARRGLNARWKPEHSPSYKKAERLFLRYGGLALVFGRFAGPVSGMVPFAAAVTGMTHRRFLAWNIASAVPYALAHVALGYWLGDILARIGPIATRLALFAAAVLVVLAVLWWIVLRVERMLPFVLCVLRAIAEAVAATPELRRWSARHPRLASFIVHRLDPSRVSGLTATLLGGAILYVLAIWVGSVLDFLLAEPIMQLDSRLAALIHAFWTPRLLKLAAHVTALGDRRVVASLMGATLVLLWLKRRPDLMLGLATSVGGNVVTVAILKRIFDRPRPELAYFVETSGSFPSGHAAISVAFHAMLFFIAWRIRLLRPLVAALMAATLAFLLGLSRIYLIEHYLTDVVNGWLVGTLWLLIGISLAEWWRETRSLQTPAPPPRAQRLGGIALAMLLLAVAGGTIVTYDKPRNVGVAPRGDEMARDIDALFGAGHAPPMTESIFGDPLEPVNVVILAQDSPALETALTGAGWRRIEKPALGMLARTAWALATGVEDVAAPVTPRFWHGRPGDLAYDKAAADQTIGNRHHVGRFWRTNFVTPDGLRLFVGSASLVDGLDWQRLRHIAPDVDAERDLLVTDLEKAGVVAASRALRVSKPRLGESAAGDPWFTDGRVVVVTLK